MKKGRLVSMFVLISLFSCGRSKKDEAYLYSILDARPKFIDSISIDLYQGKKVVITDKS